MAEAIISLSSLIVFLVIYGIIFLPLLAISLVAYVFQSIGLFRMSKSCQIANPWLAWVPYGNSWSLGSIADHANLYNHGKKTKFRVWMLVVSLVVMVTGLVGGVIAGAFGVSIGFMANEADEAVLGFASMIFIIAYFIFIDVLMLITVAQSVLVCLAMYRIFPLFSPEKGKTYFWVCAGSLIASMTVLPFIAPFVGIIQAVCFFILSKNQPVYADGDPDENPPLGGSNRWDSADAEVGEPTEDAEPAQPVEATVADGEDGEYSL